MCLPPNKSKKIIKMPKSWNIDKWVLSLSRPAMTKAQVLTEIQGSVAIPAPTASSGRRKGRLMTIYWTSHRVTTAEWYILISGFSDLSPLFPGPLRGSWETLHPAAASAHTLIYDQGIRPCPQLPWFSLNPNILIWMYCLLWYSTWVLQQHPQSSWQKGVGSWR